MLFYYKKKELDDYQALLTYIVISIIKMVLLEIFFDKKNYF